MIWVVSMDGALGLTRYIHSSVLGPNMPDSSAWYYTSIYCILLPLVVVSWGFDLFSSLTRLFPLIITHFLVIWKKKLNLHVTMGKWGKLTHTCPHRAFMMIGFLNMFLNMRFLFIQSCFVPSKEKYFSSNTFKWLETFLDLDSILGQPDQCRATELK